MTHALGNQSMGAEKGGGGGGGGVNSMWAPKRASKIEFFPLNILKRGLNSKILKKFPALQVEKGVLNFMGVFVCVFFRCFGKGESKPWSLHVY